MHKAAGGERTPAARQTCAIIFGAEQGLSGQFNERISAFALEYLEQIGIGAGACRLVALGEHMSYRLTAAGQSVERSFPITGTIKGMKQMVQELFVYIDELRTLGECSRVLLFYHESLSGAHNRPHMTQLFPIDPALLRELRGQPWPSRQRPVFIMDWQVLMGALIRDYLRVTLERAFVQSLLSENTSRLVAMQVAEGNIADHLEELQREFNNQRQSEITAEILDIVAGLEAVEKIGTG